MSIDRTAKILADHWAVEAQPSGHPLKLACKAEGCTWQGDFYTEHARHQAELIAPRIITTAEELDALPMDTVIRDADEYVWDRWSLLAMPFNWRCAGYPKLTDDKISFPAVVLLDPEA